MAEQQSGSFDKVEITYYTDPLCCWSWALEPQWTRLRTEMRGLIQWKYRMSGLIPNWDTFKDPMNAITRPQQMGPLWMQAQQVSGMPVADHLWINDPPASSFPACIAVKCAELQQPLAGEMLLRMLREAVMVEGKNIGKKEVWMDVAAKLSRRAPSIFNLKSFENAVASGIGASMFQEDLQKVAFYKITRFPTLIFSRPGAKSIMIVGYRPYEAMLQALMQIAPEIKPQKDNLRHFQHMFSWQLTQREEQEIDLAC